MGNASHFKSSKPKRNLMSPQALQQSSLKTSVGGSWSRLTRAWEQDGEALCGSLSLTSEPRLPSFKPTCNEVLFPHL